MIKNAEFLTSVADISTLPNTKIEIAVSGKSNVGKSSFINAITAHGKLARTSKEPGRTRLLNYFMCNKGRFTLVDFPGYGYAKVSNAEKTKWAYLIEAYLASGRVKHLLQLLDIRHDPTVDDVMMINYLYHYNIPFTLIATKADKLSKAELGKRRQSIASFLKVGIENIYVFSSETKQGKELIDARLLQIVDFYENFKLEEETPEDSSSNE